MGTVIFDFDSTLVPCESLEELLADVLGKDDTGALERIAAITRDGMDGRIGFRESLEQRLAIARPTRDAVVATGERLARGLTDGAAELVSRLVADRHTVWIVSGGFRDLLLPPGRALGLPDGRIRGVQPRWTASGAFAGLDPDDAFTTSKVAGVQQLQPDWPGPRIVVGDGMTDHALAAAGLADHFVAYTQHVQRDPVLATGAPQAASMADLDMLLTRWLAAPAR